MKALTQNLVIGLLAASLVICGGRALLAGPPPGHGGYPGGHPGYYGHHPDHFAPHPYHQAWNSYGWHYPIVVYRQPSPVVVYDTRDVSNATPSIRLVNPAANRTALRYTLNGGEVQSLAAGYSVAIGEQVVIEFDRGGAAGQARYTLDGGTFKFVPVNGLWSLVRDSGSLVGDGQLGNIAANPLPGM